jgi:hypothetical protein
VSPREVVRRERKRRRRQRPHEGPPEVK